jgi:hypothetical protein
VGSEGLSCCGEIIRKICRCEFGIPAMIHVMLHETDMVFGDSCNGKILLLTDFVLSDL